MKIKIIVGFRKDQEYSIPADEAHKAYYLFMNPDERGVFKDGLALVGKDIKAIEPDYNGTMGWNATHQLDEDDWNQIRSRGIDRKLRNILTYAKEITSGRFDESILEKPIQQIKKEEKKAIEAGGDLLKGF